MASRSANRLSPADLFLDSVEDKPSSQSDRHHPVNLFRVSSNADWFKLAVEPKIDSIVPRL